MAARQIICDGTGACLMQNDKTDPWPYGKYPNVICHHDCRPIKCPNFAVCGEECPQWYLGCHGGRCWGCKDRFGKNLTFPEEPQECPICMEVKSCVVQPNCTHTVCIDCFKRTYIDGPPRSGQPQFPYPDREDEYFDHGPFQPPHPLEADPLVLKYHADVERWEEEQSRLWQAEENLRKCPLCRS